MQSFDMSLLQHLVHRLPFMRAAILKNRGLKLSAESTAKINRTPADISSTLVKYPI